MSSQCYWAAFHQVNSDIFRYDTRIYLVPVTKPRTTDVCIGAVIEKNPGSAKASNLFHPELQQIALQGDKLLPTVRSIIQKSYDAAGKVPSAGEYIQVLNLFYLCNPDLGKAVISMGKYGEERFCSTEASAFPWAWYVWGGNVKSLSTFKSRFSSLNTQTHFYFDKNADAVASHSPDHTSFAKHTQGLKQESIIQHIAALI